MKKVSLRLHGGLEGYFYVGFRFVQRMESLYFRELSIAHKRNLIVY